MTEFFDLEEAAIRAIISAQPASEALKAQFDQATVTSRENTGAGFYTDIFVPPTAPSVTSGSPIGNVDGTVEGLEYGMGFILFMEDGRMSCLEGFSYEEATVRIDFSCVRYTLSAAPSYDH